MTIMKMVQILFEEWKYIKRCMVVTWLGLFYWHLLSCVIWCPCLTWGLIWTYIFLVMICFRKWITLVFSYFWLNPKLSKNLAINLFLFFSTKSLVYAHIFSHVIERTFPRKYFPCPFIVLRFFMFTDWCCVEEMLIEIRCWIEEMKELSKHVGDTFTLWRKMKLNV